MKSRGIIGLVLTVVGTLAVAFKAMSFFAGQSLDVKISFSVVDMTLLLVFFILLAAGLVLLSNNSGEDAGYKRGLKDGEKGLIASLSDKGVIHDILKPLPAGEYKLLKIFEESDTISCGLLLVKRSGVIEKVSYYEKNYPLRRLREGQEFMVNDESVIMTEVVDTFVKDNRAFVIV